MLRRTLVIAALAAQPLAVSATGTPEEAMALAVASGACAPGEIVSARWEGDRVYVTCDAGAGLGAGGAAGAGLGAAVLVALLASESSTTTTTAP
jgi:hypothetical protein